MAITQKQIEMTQEFRTRLRNEIRTYSSAPEEITEPLDMLWQAFKAEAEFDDDNQADLAGFGALAQFIMLSDELDDSQLRSFLTLYATSILVKIKKGDRLD